MAAPTTASKKSKPKKPRGASTTMERTAKTAAPSALGREIGGVIVLAIALAVLLALASFNPVDLLKEAPPTNLIGPAGARIGDALLLIFGVGAFFLNALLWYLGVAMLIGRQIEARTADVTGKVLFVFAGTVLSHLVL
jgi:hypothetical protein